MPMLSRFFGIVIMMYWRDHARPIFTPDTVTRR